MSYVLFGIAGMLIGAFIIAIFASMRNQALRRQYERLKNRAEPKKRKRLEFSQKIALMIVMFSMFIVFFTVCLNFALLWSYRNSMAQETIQTISVFGGVTATAGTFVYGALAGWRDYSKNKTGVTHGEMYIPGPYAMPAEENRWEENHNGPDTDI